jgi:hypothetical protein
MNKMPRSIAPSPQTDVAPTAALGSGLGPLGVAALIIAALYVGREVFVPIALAILLSFVLAPLIRLLQHIHVPRAIAVVGVVVLAFAGISAVAGLMATQATQLAGDLPRYQSNMRQKIMSLRGSTGSAGSGALERASDVLQDLSNDKPQGGAARAPNPLAPAASTTGEAKPIPVEVRQPDPGALQMLGAFITPLLHPLATTGIVVIFVIFILLQREDLRNRLIRLAGAHDLQKTTAALDDAGARLSRLFLIQLGVNAALDRSFGDRRRHAQWLQSSDRLSQRDGTARRRCGVEIPDQGPLGRGDRVPLSAGLSGHWSGCNCGSVQGSRQCDRRHGWLHVQDRRAPDLDAGQGAS